MNQYGRSMIEMLGVLAIIGVLSVGGIAGYTKAMTKYKTNATTELMLTIATNLQNASLRTKKYDENLQAVAIKMKTIPDKALSSDGKSLGLNPFGGTVGLGSFQPSSFYVAMNGLPKDACVEMSTQNFGNALIYAGTGEFSNETLKSLKDLNFRASNPTCSASAPYYCIKEVMTPAVAAKACNCTSAGGCSVALVMF